MPLDLSPQHLIPPDGAMTTKALPLTVTRATLDQIKRRISGLESVVLALTMPSGKDAVPTIEAYQNLRPMVRLPAHIATVRSDERSLQSFTVLTYNILAQDHIYRTAYPYCGKHTLKWNQRKSRLAAELEAYDADIVCFQEMDRFHSYFQPLLFRRGYDTRYYLRNGPDSNVNLVGWKQDKFRLVGEKKISFEGTTLGMGSVPNVAQIVALQSIAEPRCKLIVATTHLYWRAECDHIRLIQLHSLVRELLELRAELGEDYMPIIAGDLNSDKNTMAIQAALRSDPSLTRPRLDEIAAEHNIPGYLLSRVIEDFTINWPRFYDAHEHYACVVPGSNGYDLPFTTFCLYKGILDFILYTRDRSEARIVPTALRIIPDRSVLEAETALPNNLYASDHLALVVRFTLVASDVVTTTE